MSLRNLYYRLPPDWRLVVRKVVFAPLDLFSNERYVNGLPVPPRSLIYTGGGDFKKTGERFLGYFKKYGLQPESNVLDIGSGIGRIALPLTNYINGEYLGIDIMKVGVQWCAENITAEYPKFQFKLLEVKNDLYRNSGNAASKVKLPIESQYFDFCCLISVFTHMQPEEVENYLLQINEGLKNGGTCFATFFIFDKEEELVQNHFNPFILQNDNYALMDEKVTSANVAFSMGFLRSMFQRCGFEMTYLSKGRWRFEDGQEDFQDFVVLKKIDREG